MAVDEQKHAPWEIGAERGEEGGGEKRGGGLWVTVPDQLAVDKKLEFGVKFWETDRQRGPVMSSKDREEIMDRRTVSKNKGRKRGEENQISRSAELERMKS